MPLLRKNPRALAEKAVKSGDFTRAGELYEELGERYFADYYEKAGQHANRTRKRRCEVALALELDREELAASYYMRARRPDQAAVLYRKLGEDLKAAHAFLEAGHMVDAAAAFVDAGDVRRGAELYEQEGKSQQAAELLEEIGDRARAGELFAKIGLFLKAAECYQKHGDFLTAGEIYEKSGRIREAAASFAKASDFTRAAALYSGRVAELTRDGYLPPQRRSELDTAARGAAHFFEKAGEKDEAVDVLVRAERYEQAAELCEQLERFARAAELYQEVRNNKKAAEMYARAGDDLLAAKLEAEHHLDHGNDDAAAESLMRSGDTMAAAELFDRSGRFDRATECWEALEAWPQAAEAAARAGLDDKAALYFERAGESARAAELYLDLGIFDKAAPLFAAVERFYEAAQAASEANAEREMLQYLQQVPEEDASYNEAVVILARAFIRRGWGSMAVERLEAVLAGQTVEADNLALWDPLAEALEDIGELKRAEELLRKIMSVSYNYADTDQRHRRLLEKIAEEKQRESSFNGMLVAGKSSDEGAVDGNRYKLDELIGKGGMGEVYRAFDRLLSRPLAYKVLSSKLARDPTARDQLLQEARAAAALNHPNIITIHDLGIQDGRAFICMELVEGESYASILKREESLPIAEVMHLIVSACQGLEHAHHRGIVHRDIKPSNILLTKEHRVKILDFGLAQPIQTDDESSGFYGGTPKYIAPEQARGEATDARTDLYSFGAMLFELIAGRAPFIEDNLIQHHLHTPPPPLKSVAPFVSDELNQLVGLCLAKEPSARFQSAGELLSFAQTAGLV